jgi:hypothetical protein
MTRGEVFRTRERFKIFKVVYSSIIPFLVTLTVAYINASHILYNAVYGLDWS